MAKTQIHGSQIKNETITGNQIQDNSIDSADIKDGSINSVDIARGAISDIHISNTAAISASKISITDSNNYFNATNVESALAEEAAARKAHEGSGGNAHALATQTTAGFMSAPDKAKLDTISTGANKVEPSSTNGNIKIDSVETTVYTHPIGDGNLHVPPTGTTNNNKVLKAGATPGTISWGSVNFSELTGKPTTLSGYGITDAVNTSEVVTTPTPNKILKLDSNSKLPASITGNADGNAATASKLQTARTISLSGDVSGSTTFDGSANATINVTLSNTGVASGTYTKVTVDSKGRVTSATTLSPTDIPNLTLSKITDAGTAASRNVGTSAGNVPVLDSSGKLDSSILPALAITDTFVVNDQNAMLTLNAQVGDIVVRTDLNKTFILKAEPASVLSNWQELLTPTDSVLSVNGKTGAVTITAADVGLGNVTNESKATMFNNPTFTGTPTAPTPPTSDNSNQIATTAFVKNQGYLTQNQNITISGDATGSGNTSINLTLSNTGVTPGTYTKVTVDSKGRVTSASNPTTLSGYGIIDAVNTSEVVTTATPNKILKLDSNGKLPASITGNADGNAATASKLQTARTISLSGDVSGSTSFDGSANATINVSLSNTGVTPGTYAKVTVDAKGRVTTGTTLAASDIPNLDWSKITTGKPTTLSGYGITDGVNAFLLPQNGASVSYVKIAELTTNIGAGENGLILYLNGVSDFGNNMPGVDVLQVSTRGSVNLKVYRLIPSGTNDVSYGYVNNGSTGKTEIWLKRDAYNYGLNIIVANARNATYGNLLTQGTEPSGITYVTKDTIALTTDNVSSASKLQTARNISLSGDVSGSTSFDGSVDTSINVSLSNTGVTPGTYKSVTVDAKGRITSGSNPTTLSGYGITDAVNISEVVTTATPNKILKLDSNGKLPASITGNAETATNVNWSGVTNKPTTLSGYGITDATPSSHIGSGGNAHALANSNTAGFMSPELYNKLKNMKSTTLSISAGQQSIVWTHNFGSTNYAISVIPNQPAINFYYKNKTDNSIEIAFYEITGTTVDAYGTYDRTKPVNIDVTLMPLT